MADPVAVAETVVDPDELRAAVWERVRTARNVKRPHTLELLHAMATDVIELHGDRLFRDDAAIVGGFCRIDGRRAVFVGHQKGAETEENIRRNFGMPHPEGYRKAIRLYRLAERLQLPVVTFIDTPGAFPGPASEERGVAEAIARSIMVMTGLATLDGRSIAVIGQQKGADTDENIRRNFGMPHPEGYRKAMRVMELAERFELPVVTFVDVPGAHPGAESEERGIAEAIARSISLMTRLRTPIVTVITGEGGSGGALALAVGDVVLALENSIYSVISPEGAASILWRSPEYSQQAAVAMRLTAAEQLALGVIDEVVAEPAGGAHESIEETARLLRPRIAAHLDSLAGRDRNVLLDARYARYRRMGEFAVVTPSGEPRPERPGVFERIRRRLESGRAAIAGGVSALPSLADETDEPPLQEDV